LSYSLKISKFLSGSFFFLQTSMLKSSVFWDTTPCSPLKLNRRFGGICCLHLQGRRISPARNQHESTWQAELSCWFHAWLIRAWRWRQHVHPKVQLTFNGLHGVISQKIELFITTAVRTSNPTYLWWFGGPRRRPGHQCFSPGRRYISHERISY
jgi:hypothetical protein